MFKLHAANFLEVISGMISGTTINYASLSKTMSAKIFKTTDKTLKLF